MKFFCFLNEKIVQIVLLTFAVITIEILLMLYSFANFKLLANFVYKTQILSYTITQSAFFIKHI